MRTAMLVMSTIALAASAAYATPIILEAEDYVGSWNMGGEPIHVVLCSGASGGFAVEGYDTIGDFIELRVVLSQAGEYEAILRSGGELFEYSQHFTRFRRENGGTITFTTFSTMGMGIG